MAYEFVRIEDQIIAACQTFLPIWFAEMVQLGQNLAMLQTIGIIALLR